MSKSNAKRPAGNELKNLILTEETEMSAIFKKVISLDNEDRRSGADRRNFSYTMHIPERRSGKERRIGEDRRKTRRAKIVEDQ